MFERCISRTILVGSLKPDINFITLPVIYIQFIYEQTSPQKVNQAERNGFDRVLHLFDSSIYVCNPSVEHCVKVQDEL